MNAAGTFGNGGRTVRAYGPSQWNVDTAIWRTFPLSEAVKMDFRFEAFNVFNHTRFNSPNTSLAGNEFGKITSALDPRILQLAVKMAF